MKDTRWSRLRLSGAAASSFFSSGIGTFLASGVTPPDRACKPSKSQEFRYNAYNKVSFTNYKEVYFYWSKLIEKLVGVSDLTERHRQ